jgi:hypothetical protein
VYAQGARVRVMGNYETDDQIERKVARKLAEHGAGTRAGTS